MSNCTTIKLRSKLTSSNSRATISLHQTIMQNTKRLHVASLLDHIDTAATPEYFETSLILVKEIESVKYVIHYNLAHESFHTRISAIQNNGYHARCKCKWSLFNSNREIWSKVCPSCGYHGGMKCFGDGNHACGLCGRNLVKAPTFKEFVTNFPSMRSAVCKKLEIGEIPHSSVEDHVPAEKDQDPCK